MKRLVGSLFLVSGLLVSGAAQATYYAIHLSGMCSKDWGATSCSSSNNCSPGAANSDSGQGGTKALGPNFAYPINAFVDQQQASLSTASTQFKNNYLNVYCTGSNHCAIYDYSAGDLIVGYTFNHSTTY